jgi:glycosyltransferase involved in cell wall biosynthesis
MSALGSRPALRIAHVDAESGYSGGEAQVFLLLRGLRERGHANLLLCPPGSEAARRAQQLGIEHRCVPMRNDLDLVGFCRLRGELARARPDLVHLHTGRATWLGGLAAHSLGLPALSTRRMDRRVRGGWRTRLIYRSLVQRAVAISPAVQAALAAAGVDARRTRLIRSAVDPLALAARVPREFTRGAEGAGPDELVILCVAALVRRKGIDLLIGALARLAHAGHRPWLWIAGEGPEFAALDAQARALELRERVRLLKRRVDVPELLAACDIFALPSRQEGLGVAALEALAARRPVVATRVGGLAEAVVHERCGLIVEPEDEAGLAQALARLCGDAALRARLGANGPARLAEGFLAEQMVAAYDALYAEILAERAAPARIEVRSA